MKIRKETVNVLENEDGIKALAPTLGESVHLVLRDGAYHAGKVSKITGDSITIRRKDGDHTYSADEIEDIKSGMKMQM